MSSEADLDADVKALSILSEHPDLYEEFAKLGCVASLVSLLSHENTDIAIDAIEIINELTDEDVEAEQAQWDTLVDALVCNQCVALMVMLMILAGCRPAQSLVRKSFPDEREERVRSGWRLPCAWYAVKVLARIPTIDKRQVS